MPFSRKLFGYDRRQVDAAVTRLTLDAVEAAQEAERLTAELDRQRVSVEDLRQDHDKLSMALVSAHKAAQEIRMAAELDAQATISDARKRADAIVREAEDAIRIIEAEVDSLVRRRQEAEQSYASFIESMVKAYESSRMGAKPSLTATP